jgi:hypothetical protein
VKDITSRIEEGETVDRKDFIRKASKGELEPVAVASITNNSALAIYEVVHDIEDFVCGALHTSSRHYFRRKINYDIKGNPYFNYMNRNWTLDEFVRVS